MGSHVSKNNTPGTSSGINLNANNMATELSSYEAACKLDSDLQSFDATIQTRTSKLIYNIAAGVEGRSISFYLLWQVTECLVEMSQNVAAVILDCEKDILKEKELSELVDEYFENSLETLKLYNALKKCLESARNSQLPVRQALQHFDEDSEKVGNSRYARTLEGLKKFKEAGEPFTEEFFQKYESVCEKQKLMLKELKLRKNKLDEKLKSTHTWRKVSSVIFGVTAAALLICSVVAAVVAFPHVAMTLAAVTPVAGPMGMWIDSYWKEYQNALQRQKEETNSVYDETYVTIKELDHIRVRIDGLKDKIESLTDVVDFVIEKEPVKVAIEEIRKKVGDFMKDAEDLGAQADTCSRDVLAGRKEVLRRIKMRPHN